MAREVISTVSPEAPIRRRDLVSPSRDDAAMVIGRPGARLQGPRRFTHLLLFVVAAFFASFVAWASWARLEEVTRGDGRVIPSSYVQVVQNLEGGIVAAILVREGEVVDQGQILVRIDDVRAQSDLRETRQRHLALVGAIARLRAEIDGLGLAFPDEVHAEAPEVARNEQALFEARRMSLESNLAILGQQAEQRDRELEELEARLQHAERSHQLALEEWEITEPLAASHVVPKLDLLRLERQINDLEGELDTTRLAIARVEAARREAYQRIDEQQLSFRAEAQRELNTVQAEADALAAAMAAESDRLKRTDVRSPVRGTVKQLLVTTVGGVVQPGADLVEIVPLDDTLLVEARIRPADIAFVRPGQSATVKVTAYDFSIYGGLKGEVEDISADTIADERGERFFRVRVRTADNVLRKGDEALPIIPGMTTQVDVLTGEKTVMDYLLKPILKAKQQALRER
jgi:adhesin transport system membrane fusion protein